MSALTAAQRDTIPPEDFAGPNQSFYIRNQADLDAVARLYGRAADPAAVKRRAILIARRKGLTLPAAWEQGM